MSVKSLLPVILFLLLIVFATNTLAQGGAEIDSTFVLARAVIGSGGVHASGAGFDLDATAGQPVAGPVAGGAFGLGAGFWAAAPAVYTLYLPLILR